MDKEAASQFFTSMKTQIKRTKMMVCQKACRDVKNLGKKIEYMEASREESKDIVKLDKNIARLTKKRDNRLEEYKLVKQADPFEISTQVSLKSPDHWKKVLDNSEESRHNKALARIASHNSMKVIVDKFKKDHLDWESWLPELIELWISKRKLKQNGLRTNRTLKVLKKTNKKRTKKLVVKISDNNKESTIEEED